ncbi:MAG TPA: Bax inhibitor-1/YccA family protein [bacterium]
MRTANPALSAGTFSRVAGTAGERAMSVQGTVNKTAVLLLLVVISSAWIWNQAWAGAPVQGWMLAGLIGGLITGIVTVFKQRWAPVTAPVYALLEGLALGGISAAFERAYPGIVIQAVTLTFGTLTALLLAYTSRLISVTQNFRLGVAAATGGILLVYLASFVLSFFGVRMSFLYDSSPLSIGISLFVVVIASLNLVLDFDFIEHAAERRLPAYMEWYAGFGLLVTLVWLYIEILRLLAKLRSRR